MAAMPKAGLTYSPKIPAPDYTKIKNIATDTVKRELGVVVRPDVLIVKAAEIVRQADAEIALHADERNAAVASLWFYDQVLSLDQTIGVARNAYREILSKALYGDAKKPVPALDDSEELQALAKHHGVPRIPDAASNVVELARIVASARARRAAALFFMQEAALVLCEAPYEWTPDKIAEHADITRRLVYNLRDAAAKRRDK
ncbi:hypothetical protein [Streptomyces rubiginosohelvolus]|uniref:hypothetical protein n=1 Tax=Streptomyces rubiginosohelvolus TaxID=67362 RepID=UPI0035E31108